MRRFSSIVGQRSIGRRAYADVKPAAAAAAAGKPFAKVSELIGYIHSIDGTIATVVPSPGSPGVAYNTIIQIQVSANMVASGLVFNLEKDGRVGIILMDNIHEVKSGQKVMASGQLLSIPCGFNVLGKVVNPLGHEIPTGLYQRSCSLLQAASQEMGRVDTNAPNIVSRSPVNYNLLTGFKS
eukprot:PhF_6_TR40256/c1_g1_i2/m.59950/K02111/ATPF1A, atpA; F-type H+-transporting ATPase subunit alpha